MRFLFTGLALLLLLRHRLLPQPGGFEGFVFRPKVLPAHDLPVPELDEAAGLDVRLQAAASRSHMDGAPGEHPLAEIGELVVGSNLSKTSKVSETKASMPESP